MSRLRELFGVERPLIAMCHLAGLPGRPRHDVVGGVERLIESLWTDVDALQRGGVDGLLFCNENDLPYQLAIDPAATAAMAAAISRLKPQLKLPFGVDMLWDAKAALAVARATGAGFVREVFTGVFESDMGLMAPDFGEIAAYRQHIGAASIAIFTNITPEFSRSVAQRSVAERARGAAYMGVDALLISGQAAGVSAEMEDLKEARAAVPTIPILANTGVSQENIERVLAVADGVIVGTSLKREGSTWNPVDPERVLRMMEIVDRVRSAHV